MGKEETQNGAEYRARKAQELQPDASVWIGIENGMYREHVDYIYLSSVSLGSVGLTNVSHTAAMAAISQNYQMRFCDRGRRFA